jgi:regulator of protease activity HflC (stomatin/prohibitin superfamily)
VAAVGVELVLRALARPFLPPPDPHSARAAVGSALAAALPRGGAAARGGLAEPVRQHFGLDFSRSWALAYARAAALPLLLALALLAWGLSGVVLVGPDERAIYERLGAPVAVLHPGLHAILPWPLGYARRLEYGPVHAVPLGAGAEAQTVAAEDPAPRSADRLWEGTHPAEVAFLIASRSHDGQELFQVVNADIRVLWRVGLADRDALHAAYRLAAPEALVRAASGRVAGAFFAGQTLGAVLGENREAVAERMRAAVQRDLDGADMGASGIEVVAVVIEAVHPPVGAAAAYHGVQAAEIQAAATLSAEQGRAAAALSSARQRGADLVAKAQAAGAEQTGEAAAALARFNADRAADRAGADAFLLERYFAALAAALPKVPVTVVDSRIAPPDAPVLDLRPPNAATAPGAGPGME